MTTAKKTTATKTRSTSTRKKTSARKKPATKPRTVTVKKKELPANPMVHELLEAVDSERVKASKLDLLRTHGDDSFKMILIWNFDESVISLLPEGDVPYGDADDQSIFSGSLSDNITKEAKGGESATGQDLDGRGKTSLRREYQKLYHCV
jgi:hypothetical protein